MKRQKVFASFLVAFFFLASIIAIIITITVITIFPEMLVFYYHLVPELMPILWRAKLSCAIELGSTREKHTHKQQKKKEKKAAFAS